MSKIFTTLEQAINNGDWQSVCDVYFKMTGKKINPPKPKEVFDPDTATKTQLYKKIKEFNKNIPPAKEYSLEDLRQLYTLYKDTHTVEEESPVKPTVQKKEALSTIFIANKDRLLNVDKQPFNPRLTDFDTYDDEGDSKVARTRTDERITAVCKICSQEVLVNPILVTGKNENGTRACICGKCSH